MKFIKSFRFSFNFLLFLNYLFGYFFTKFVKPDPDLIDKAAGSGSAKK